MNCPFCGSDNVVGTYTNVYMGTEEVLCEDCGQYFEVDIDEYQAAASVDGVPVKSVEMMP